MATRTSASVISRPSSARWAIACTVRLAAARLLASPLSETPPPGVSMRTWNASSISAAWRLLAPETARTAASDSWMNSGARLNRAPSGGLVDKRAGQAVRRGAFDLHRNDPPDQSIRPGHVHALQIGAAPYDLTRMAALLLEQHRQL